MHLGVDRIEVLENERVHAALIVHPPMAVVTSAGGIAYLRHQLEDVGFRDVRAWTSPPEGWARGNIPTPSDLEWRLWIAATPIRSSSYRRELTEDMRVVDAWVAGGEVEPALPPERRILPPHPYAVEWSTPTRDAIGIVRAFGVAYPLPERMV